MFTEIQLESLSLTASNGYYITNVKGLGYTTKYPVAKVAQFHGVKIGNAFYDNRVLSIEMKIVGDSVDDYIAKRKALFAELTLHEFSTDLHTISITLHNGIVLTAEGIAQALADDYGSVSPLSGDVAFTFEMQEPFFKSSQVVQIDIPVTQGGGGTIPMAVPFDMSVGSGGYSDVSQGGNVFCYPEIYFYGELTNPVLRDLTSNKSLALSTTLATVANYYYIDTYNRIVIDETVANKRDKMTGDFLVINVGTSQFTLSTDDSSETGFVRLIYKDYYISI